MSNPSPSPSFIAALQQRMAQLGFGVSAAGVYGDAEDTVVKSYAAQLGITDFSNLDVVIGQILPVMDADIEVKGVWQPPPAGTLTPGPLTISGGSASGFLWLALVGAGVWWMLRR